MARPRPKIRAKRRCNTKVIVSFLIDWSGSALEGTQLAPQRQDNCTRTNVLARHHPKKYKTRRGSAACRVQIVQGFDRAKTKTLSITFPKQIRTLQNHLF